jgi:rare lipoprotein A
VQPSLPDFAVDAVSEREGEAMWYDVPAKSLAERRAWSGEMTAASDTLPLNTYVRVRQVSTGGNGRSVVVRITDRGIHRKGTLIDLDRPAAEALGMVSKGAVRVRVETLALLNADADKPTGRKDAATEPADQITSTPAASREQEKAAAAAKAGRPVPP